MSGDGRLLLALVRRELVRLSRQRARVIGLVGTVVLLWAFLGSGLRGSFAGSEGESYGVFLVAGMATMAVVFSSIFAAISLIEDRETGLLRAALVSSAPMRVILGSKLVAASVVSLVQAGLVVVVGVLVFGGPSLVGMAMILVGLVCIAVGVSGVSLWLGWRCESVAGFHGVMNLVLMPMWLLSGALFPVDTAGDVLAWIARVNPLTYPTGLVRAGTLGGGLEDGFWADLAGSLVFIVIGIGLMLLLTRRGGGGSIGTDLANRNKEGVGS